MVVPMLILWSKPISKY